MKILSIEFKFASYVFSIAPASNKAQNELGFSMFF